MSCKKSSSCMLTTVCHYPSKMDLDRKKTTTETNVTSPHIFFHLLAPFMLLIKKCTFISDNVNKYFIFFFQ